jgi:hypothetical protein
MKKAPRYIMYTFSAIHHARIYIYVYLILPKKTNIKRIKGPVLPSPPPPSHRIPFPSIHANHTRMG